MTTELRDGVYAVSGGCRKEKSGPILQLPCGGVGLWYKAVHTAYAFIRRFESANLVDTLGMVRYFRGCVSGEE
jgi:hypothetical protein